MCILSFQNTIKTASDEPISTFPPPLKQNFKLCLNVTIQTDKQHFHALVFVSPIFAKVSFSVLSQGAFGGELVNKGR